MISREVASEATPQIPYAVLPQSGMKIWYIVKESISEIPCQVNSDPHQRRNDLVTVLTKSSVKLL